MLVFSRNIKITKTMQGHFNTGNYNLEYLVELFKTDKIARTLATKLFNRLAERSKNYYVDCLRHTQTTQI